MDTLSTSESELDAVVTSADGKLDTVATDTLKRFFLAVEWAADHIVMTDAKGVIVYANHAAEKMTGYTREDMNGKTPALWGKQMS